MINPIINGTLRHHLDREGLDAMAACLSLARIHLSDTPMASRFYSAAGEYGMARLVVDASRGVLGT